MKLTHLFLFIFISPFLYASENSLLLNQETEKRLDDFLNAAHQIKKQNSHPFKGKGKADIFFWQMFDPRKK